MKPKSTYLINLMLLCSLISSPNQTFAQVPVVEVIKAGVTKAIKALDLKVQRMQNETIRLQNAQKVLENHLTRLKLREIAEWTEKQRAQYGKFYQELLDVKNAIVSSQRIRDITRSQATLLREYQAVWSHLRGHPRFSPDEVRQMERVYANMLQENSRQLEQLLLVLTPSRTSMSDAERLELIATTSQALHRLQKDLRLFNHQNLSIALNRAKTRQEVNSLLTLFGFTQTRIIP